MKTVVEPRESFARVWGTQKPKNTEYRLMKYILRTECEDGTLLHNAMTGQLVLLESGEASLLRELPRQYTEAMTPLIEAHFLVPSEYDERKATIQLRSVLRKMGQGKDITGYTILPTSACNARCFYCYESGFRKRSMSPGTADRVVDYIAAHCGEKKEVSVRWFGGEPLVGADRIQQISEGLRAKKITYTSSMISNGYLFTPELAKTAKEDWKLTNIQITLDGTHDTYNRVKAYVGVTDDPYYRVLDNIGELLKNEIRVSVRLNLDRYNAEDLYRLADELAARFSGKTLFSAYAHVLYDDCGYDIVHHSDEDKRELFRIQLDLEDYMKKLGIFNGGRELPFLRINACMADNRKSVLVNPDGAFGVCEHFSDEHLIGDMNSETLDAEEIARWMTEKEQENCAECPLRPGCLVLALCPGGGCFAPLVENRIDGYRKQMREIYENKRDGKAEDGDISCG